MYTMKTKYELVLLALVVLLESISLESQAKHRRGPSPKGQFGRYRIASKSTMRKEFTFGCQCGIADQGADNAKPNFTSPYEMPKLRISKKTRIVGGYTPKDRPWMALLELEGEPKDGFLTTKNSQCGGAIINKVSALLLILFEKLSPTIELRLVRLLLLSILLEKWS